MSQYLLTEELADSSDELSISGDIDSGIGSSTPSPLTVFKESHVYSTPGSLVPNYSLDANEAVFEPDVDSRTDVLLDLQIESRGTHNKGSTHCADVEYIFPEETRNGLSKNLCHENNSRLGWRVSSKVNFTTHEIILTEEPLVVLPCQPWSPENPICVNCGALLSAKFNSVHGKNNLSTCIICKWPMCHDGCDFEEDTNYKNLHSSLECSLICKSNFHWSGNPTFYQYLWVIRMSVVKRKDPIQFEKILELSTFMGENYDRIYLTDQVQYSLRNHIPPIHDVLTGQELQKVFKILMYGFRPMHFVGAGEKKLRALYLEASTISHSCDPNVEYWVDESFNQTLVAVRPIKAGEILTISFMDELVFLPTPERRRRLLQNFNIYCNCNRCKDPTEFQTNFSSPLCRQFNVCPCVSQPPLWTASHFLYQTNSPELRSDYQCQNCYQLTLKEKIIRWEKRLEDSIYQDRNNLYWLRIQLCKLYRQRKVHHTHFLFFRASWRLLELLSGELTQAEFFDEGQYLKFIIAAESVHQVFKAFLPNDIPLASRVLRTVSLIKLAVLTDDIQNLSLSVPEIHARLQEVYFTKNVDLAKIFKYYDTTRASDPSEFKGTFDWVEHYGIEKFVQAISTSLSKRPPTEALQLLVPYILRNQ